MTDPAPNLRALYRRVGEAGYAEVRGEYARLLPDGSPRLDQILANAWTEGRQLAGQTYDYARQTWHSADGRAVNPSETRQSGR